MYARVSTRDKDQNPETQLLRLRQFVAQHPDWQVTKTYVDQASANDLLHRTAWKALQDDAIQHRLDAVLVFKLDRAFRSVKHMHDTLAIWGALSVGFLSAQEGFNTATPIGRLLLNLLASLAEFELDTISERVRAGMARAKRIYRAKQEGKRFGNRPIETNAKKWQATQAAVRAVETRQLSYRQAAKQYGVSVSTIQRTQVKLKQKDPA
ncbi:MAG: recombinase family protein [Firmicutes bacterium]|nr:recombinase family protein [Bacillota bacterium]